MPPGASLHDRGHELGIVAAALARARDGAGGTVLLLGDPGAGKSALLEAAVGPEATGGALVLRAVASELEQGLGLGIVRQLFESHLATLTDGELQEVVSGQAAAARAVLEYGDHAIPDEQVRHSLSWLVANLAERAPLVLAIDDLHWADQASARWLLHLAHRVGTMRVVVVTTSRPPETTADHGAPALVDVLAAEAATTTLDLGPLSESAVGVILRERFGVEPDPAFVAACAEWTGGNALFLTELAAELAKSRVPPRSESVALLGSLSLPDVTRVTTSRLSRLPAELRRFAGLVAVLGPHAELGHAASLAGVGLPQAAAWSDELVAARLLLPGFPLRFVHPVVAAAVYDGQPAATRALEHLRAARALAAAGTPDGEVATHLLRSPAAGDAATVELLIRAARADLARGATGEASTVMGRALREPPPADRRGEVLRLLGEATVLSGDPAGLVTLREAMSTQTDPVARADTGYLWGRLLLFAGRVHESVAVLEPLAATLPAGDDLGQRIEAAYLASTSADLGATSPSRERLERCRAVASPTTPGGRLLCAQLAVHETRVGEDRQAAVGYAVAALADGRLLAESQHSPDSHIIAASMLALCDELGRARQHYELALDAAARTGSVVTYVTAAAIGSWAAYLCGDLEQAQLWCRDVLRIGEESPAFAALTGFARAHLATVLLELDDTAGAAELLAEVPAASPAGPDLLLASAELALAEGRLPDAIEVLRGCGAVLDRAGIVNPAWSPWRSLLAVALHGVGRGAEAELLASEAVDRARRFGAPRPLAVALRAQAQIVDDARAAVLLEESVDLLRGGRARLDLARSLAAWGSLLRRGRRMRDGTAALDEALVVAEGCGALRLGRTLRSELGRGARAHRGAGALTAAERRVCQLAAEGMSNPEIAQALFVSRATVESHLHAAYGKLGIDRRGHLGAALAYG